MIFMTVFEREDYESKSCLYIILRLAVYGNGLYRKLLDGNQKAVFEDYMILCLWKNFLCDSTFESFCMHERRGENKKGKRKKHRRLF